MRVIYNNHVEQYLDKRTLCCIHCKSALEVDKDDLHHDYDQKEGDEWWEFTCPCCKKRNLYSQNPMRRDTKVFMPERED